MSEPGYYLSIYGPQGFVVQCLGPMSQAAAEVMITIIKPDDDDPRALNGCYTVAIDTKDECAIVFEAMTDD